MYGGRASHNRSGQWTHLNHALDLEVKVQLWMYIKGFRIHVIRELYSLGDLSTSHFLANLNGPLWSGVDPHQYCAVVQQAATQDGPRIPPSSATQTLAQQQAECHFLPGTEPLHP